MSNGDKKPHLNRAARKALKKEAKRKEIKLVEESARDERIASIVHEKQYSTLTAQEQQRQIKSGQQFDGEWRKIGWGYFIPALGGFGIGSFSNYLSTDPRMLYISTISISAWLICLAWHRRLWRIASFVAAISFCIAAHKYVPLKLLKELKDSTIVTVLPDGFYDKTIPISAKWEVVNNSKHDIYNVCTDSIWVPFAPYPKIFITMIGTNSVHDLQGKGVQHVTHAANFSAPLYPAPQYHILVILRFQLKPYGSEYETNTFKFAATMEKDGSYVLTPSGSVSVEQFNTNPEVH